MDKLTKRALWNAVSLVEGLEDGGTITKEAIVDALRRPLPDITPDDTQIFHAYRHLILRAGVKNADKVATYEEAAELAGTTVAAIRQLAYRGKLVKLGTYVNGRERRGVTLRSLGEWCGWSPDELKDAAAKLESFEAAD